MYLLTLEEFTELKENLKRIFSAELHLHDCCGGQYFSLDETDEVLVKYITEYFNNRNLSAVFSKDGKQFSVKRGKIC